jgi:hypothetical protein
LRFVKFFVGFALSSYSQSVNKIRTGLNKTVIDKIKQGESRHVEQYYSRSFASHEVNVDWLQ